MIYLDNAATSWPKPPEVLKAMTDVLEHAGGNPGRSGHRLSIAAARVIYDTREEIARFFGISVTVVLTLEIWKWRLSLLRDLLWLRTPAMW